MDRDSDLKNIERGVRSLRDAATELEAMAAHLPFLRMNLVRIKAGIRMLELNISDMADLNTD